MRFLIQHMQHYTQHDMQHSNPHTPHPQGLGRGVGLGGGVAMGGIRMLHIMLCVVLHVLDHPGTPQNRKFPIKIKESP